VSRDVQALETGGFHLDLVGITLWVFPGTREGWLSLGFGWNHCAGISRHSRGVDSTQIWFESLAGDVLPLVNGGLDSDWVGMSAQGFPGNGEGWMSLGFGWNHCPGISRPSIGVDFSQSWFESPSGDFCN